MAEVATQPNNVDTPALAVVRPVFFHARQSHRRRGRQSGRAAKQTLPKRGLGQAAAAWRKRSSHNVCVVARKPCRAQCRQRKPRSACQHRTRARIFKRYGALAAEQSNHISVFHRHSADRTLVALCGAVRATHHASAGRKGGADGAAEADGAFVRECQWLVVVCLVRLCSVHCHSALRRRSASRKVVVVKEVRESAACPQIGLELAEVAGSFRRERHYPNAVQVLPPK